MILSHGYCEDEILKLTSMKVLVNCGVSFRFKIVINYEIRHKSNSSIEGGVY